MALLFAARIELTKVKWLIFPKTINVLKRSLLRRNGEIRTQKILEIIHVLISERFLSGLV
jgi:hypothetical protein